MKTVKYVGSRAPRLRVHVVVNGQEVDSRGYPVGRGTVLNVSDAEADVLLGNTPHKVDDVGKILSGFYVDGSLGEAGLTGEKWELVEEPAPEVAPTSPVEPALNVSSRSRKSTADTAVVATDPA